MHDDLAEVAWRRGMTQVVVAALVVALGVGAAVLMLAATRYVKPDGSIARWDPSISTTPPPVTDTGHPQPPPVRTPLLVDREIGPPSIVAALVAFGDAFAGVLVLLTHRGRPRSAAPIWPTVPAGRAEQRLAEALALATGTRPAGVHLLDTPPPNVGVVPSAAGWQVYVTRGATTALHRDELEAVAAAQLSLVVDRRAAALAAAGDRLRTGRVAMPALLLLLVVGFLSGDGFMWAAVFLMVGVGVATAACTGPVRYWARARIDSTCVATTRNPKALVDAIPRLAAWNGPRVDLGRSWARRGGVDRFWAAPVSRPRRTRRLWQDGRQVSVRTDEQDADIDLLVRASLVRRVCIDDLAANVTIYAETRRILDEAGRNAVLGRTTTVDGVRVGPTGVSGADDPSRLLVGSPAAPGWYADPGTAGSGWRWWDGQRWTPWATHAAPAHR